MSDYEDVEGWRVRAEASGLAATSCRGGVTTAVTMDGKELEVEIEEEGLYYVALLRSPIPIPVIIKLLESVGYRVTREGEG